MIINHVIDHNLHREERYSHRKCITTVAEKVYRETLHSITLQGEIPTFLGEDAKILKHRFNKEVRKKVQVSTRNTAQEKHHNHVKDLQVQGNLLSIGAAEKEDMLWKSSMYQLKSGTRKFMLNASIDTLPTPANLKRWKYSSCDKCKLCGNRGTTNHYLNCCKNMLNTKRYTWRHDKIVNFIATSVSNKFEVFSDLPGMGAPGGGTIPPALCVTNLKPDIVILDKHMKSMHIFELTMPLTMNIEQRHKEKTLKYTPFITDITGYTCTLSCFEVSSTGFINTRNKTTLHTLHRKFIRKDISKATFMQNINSLAWCGSYQIWKTREDPEFAVPPFLVPHLGGVEKLQVLQDQETS